VTGADTINTRSDQVEMRRQALLTDGEHSWILD